MKILAIVASNSQKSINKQLLTCAINMLDHSDVKRVDMNDYDLPIYSIDLEEEHGIPAPAKLFLEHIANADALIFSFAEHNGGYTAAYKNLFDWASRDNRNVYQNKPIVMLSTSPGKAGASNVLKTAIESAHYFAGDVVASMSFPSFFENFDTEKGEITNSQLREQLQQTLSSLNNIA